MWKKRNAITPSPFQFGALLTDEEIASQFVQSLIRRAVARLGVRGADLADLGQDVWFAMLRCARQNGLWNCGLPTFALRAGYHLLKHLRRPTARMCGWGDIGLDPSELPEPSDHSTNPEDRLSSSRTVACILSTIDALPPAERAAARSHFLEDATISAIAHEEGASQEVIRARIFRARWRIAEELTKFGYAFTKRRTGKRCRASGG